MNENKNSPPNKRKRMDDFIQLSKDELIVIYQNQQKQIEELEAKVNNSFENDAKEKTGNASHSTRRENVLVMRLACKEKEVQEYMGQTHHIKKVQEDTALLSLRQANLDPGVNLLFGKMREELQQTKDKLEQAQSELSAWKFTPDSQNGKKLISRCRTLITENQELGKKLSPGKTAELEAELALQKKYSEELKDSQEELNEFVIQLDEEVEGMQSTIQALQQQIASTREDSVKSRELIQLYENEERLRQELQNRQTPSENGSQASEDQSNSETGADGRPRSSASSNGSYEEGEYVSGSDNDGNASVTSYDEQMDEYEILETVPSDIDNELSSPSAPIDNYYTNPERNRILVNSARLNERSLSQDYATSNATYTRTVSSGSPQKMTYVNSVHSAEDNSKRRNSNSKDRVVSTSNHYSNGNGPIDNSRTHSRHRRPSDHKLRTDCRIVVSGHSDNHLVVNSS